MKSSHCYECSTTLTERNPIPLCACGCGEAFGPTYTGRNRFKRGHYRFIPDQHIVDPETGCWLWTGSVSRSGHGLARNDKGINEHAHRLYYEVLVRPLGDDEIAHHDEDKCHNKLCCNPEHQKIVSKSEHQRHHAKLQWARQRANPTEHHVGLKTKDIIAALHILVPTVPQEAMERTLAHVLNDLSASGNERKAADQSAIVRNVGDPVNSFRVVTTQTSVGGVDCGAPGMGRER